MKAKLFDRILLALLLIVTLVLSLLLIALAARVIPAANLKAFVDVLYWGANNAIILASSGLVLFVITVRLMFAGSSGKKEVQPTSTLVQATELGATFITLSAIDSMVQKHCRANNRIRNVVSCVRAVREGGITLSVRLALMPDTDIPTLSAELQKTLKEYVEKNSGINVREIGILVEDTSSNPKSRVE